MESLTRFDQLPGRRAQASARSLEVRRARAEVKRRVRDGELRLSDVLFPNIERGVERELVAGMTLLELLRAPRGMGRERADTIIRLAGVRGNPRIGKMNTASRERVLEKITTRYPSQQDQAD